MKKNKLPKILISGVLCGTIAFNSSPIFADNSIWSGQSVNNFLSNGVDAPNVLKDEKYTKDITREEFAELITGLYARSNNIDKNDIQLKENPFADTDNLDVQRAYSLGIIRGIDENTFKPNDNVTREQVATMMTRFLAITGVDTSTSNNLIMFKDMNDVSDWAFSSLAYCVENQIIKGFDDKLDSEPKPSLLPKNTASVEQVITMLDRLATKNNWIFKSQNLYVNGFLIPNDSEFGVTNGTTIYEEDTIGIGIRWSEIDNLEKLENDLNFTLKSMMNNEDYDIDGLTKMVIDLREETIYDKFIELDNFEIKYDSGIGFTSLNITIR